MPPVRVSRNSNATTTVLPNGLTRIADLPGVLTVKNNVNTYFIGKRATRFAEVGKIVNNTLFYPIIFSTFSWVTTTSNFDVLTCLRRRKSQTDTV
jgi:hypothetical protein